MKWPLLAVALLAILPLANWLRQNPNKASLVWTFVGLLPFILTAVPHTFFVAIISWAQWPGFVKGAELSVLDIIGIVVLLSQPRTTLSLPFRSSILLYFFAVLGSALVSDVPLAVIWYAWQLARVFLIYSIVARASLDVRVVGWLLNGMAIGLCLQLFVVVWQRFAKGQIQASGMFLHQNALGFMSHFVVMPYFALMLAGSRGWQTIAVPVSGTIVAILTASRATVGLLGFGLLATFVASAASRWTSRKATVALIGVLVVIVLTPFAISTFEKRFEAQVAFADSNERALFVTAAWMMLWDHPLGVGANNFVVIANTGGYYEKVGVVPLPGNRGAHVHNAYLLVLAETGYLGFASFLLLLVRPLIVAFRCGWRHRRDRKGMILLGLGVSLLTSYVHSFFEWVMVTAQSQYMLAIAIGMVAGLAQQLGYWGRASRDDTRSIRSSVSSADSRRLTLGNSEKGKSLRFRLGRSLGRAVVAGPCSRFSVSPEQHS